jgi:fatty acid desaturase
MYAFLISFVLIFIVYMLSDYRVMTKKDSNFIIKSSIIYVLLFGFARGILLDKSVLVDASYIPLVFYILWSVTNVFLGHMLTGRTNYIYFYERQNKYMS